MSRSLRRQQGTLSAWAHGILYTLLLMNSSIPLVFAGPTGGQVVGGRGSINQVGNATTINQASQNVSINWQSFNVNVNERVQFIQPNSNSVALNRILGNSGSTIAGRIDANGHVILVNPNGVFFTSTAVVNVGGIIASGLDIKPTDFMNGDYIFNEVLGTEGAVINSGTINASLGGNVALIGKQVKNDGVIVASLGTVTLAAGKQAVLTFEQGGLLGVRVSDEILQNELGVDPAVINSGEIMAEGGRVLLTASTSHDVFSQAVNTHGLDIATSAVVHADGSFTLGNGADVVNSGVIDTSTTSNDQNVGRIILIGENVLNRGELSADAASGQGGDIELHSQDTTTLAENSITSARSESNGQGGIVKVLGDKVGVFDQSVIDVSGANGGGQALIGGDFQGNNSSIRNASRTYVGRDAVLVADALQTGDGGRIINWGNDYTWFYGSAYARGGRESGNGGFVEISGKGLTFDGAVDLTAANGSFGTLLFDPEDIEIHDGGSGNEDNELDVNVPLGSPEGEVLQGDGGASERFDISEQRLENLGSTVDIILQATRDITIKDLGDGVLALQAVSGANAASSGSITFIADADNNGDGDFKMDNLSNTIRTEGGAVSITGASLEIGNIDTTGGDNLAGGNIRLISNGDGNNNPGTIIVGTLTSSGGDRTGNGAGLNAGSITIVGANGNGQNDTVSLSGDITANGSDGIGAGALGGDAGTISIRSGSEVGDSITLNGDIVALGGMGSGGGANNGQNSNITLSTPTLIFNGVRTIRNNQGNGIQGTISLCGFNCSNSDTNISTNNDLNVLAGNNVIIRGDITTGGGAFTAGSLTSRVAGFESTGFINTTGTDDVAGGDISIFSSLDITTTSLTADAGTTTDVIMGGNQGHTGERGGNITLDAVANITVAGSIITTGSNGNYNNGNGNIEKGGDGGIGGDVNITSSVGTLVDIQGSINTSGGIAGGDNNSGGAADPASGGNAGSVSISAVTATLNVGAISTNGGTGIGTAAGPMNISPVGGDANTIDITAASINISGNLNAVGGLDQSGSTIVTQGNGAAVTLTGLITGVPSINTSGGGMLGPMRGRLNRGDISFIGTLDGAPDLTLIGKDIVFSGLVGNTTRLGVLDINATGVVNADMNSIAASSVMVDSISYTSGTIDAAVGNIAVTANEIILNGDLITAAGTIDLNLNAGGSLTLAGINDFTSAATVTGNVGTETINAANRDNTWLVSATGNTLNGNLTFLNIENLIGNNAIDTFTVGTGQSVNRLDGVANNNVFTISGTVTVLDAGTGMDSVDVINGGAVTMLNGNGGMDSINIGNATTTGTVATLNGNAGNDVITITANGTVTGNLNGNLGDDVISIFNESSVGGIIDGGAGPGMDTDTLTTTGDGVTIALGSFVNQIEVINALGAGNNTLRGADATSNVWTLSTENTVFDGTDTVIFSNFAILEAGTSGDMFTVMAGADFSVTGVQTLNGSDLGNDVFTLATAGLIEFINGGDNGAADNDILSITMGNNLYVAGAVSGDGTVSDLAPMAPTTTYTSIEMTGGGVGDAIDLSSVLGDILLEDYLGFDFLITDGVNANRRLIGVDGSLNEWSIQTVAFFSDLTPGENDGMVSIDGGPTINFINFARLVGGNATDIFTITDGSLTGGVEGGGGINTLVGANVTNTWLITGTDSGNLSYTRAGSTVASNTGFLDIESLTGGIANDIYNIQGPGGDISGLINGGGGSGADTVNILIGGNIAVEIGDRVTAGRINVFQVEAINGNAATTNTLYGDSVASTLPAALIDYDWVVNGTNSGSVAYDGVTTTFSNFENLVGGSAIDQFTVSAGTINSIDMGANNDFFTITGGIVVATVDGNVGDDTFTESGGMANSLVGGDGTDFIVFTGLAVDITLGEDVGSFEGVTAQNRMGILRARAGQTTNWLIDASFNGNDSGMVTDSTEALAFSGFNTLVGGNGVDNFNISGNGSVSGLISGGVGAANDTLTVTLDSQRTLVGQVNFDGGGGNNVVTIMGTADVFNENYNPNTLVGALGTFDQLAYDNGAASLAVSYTSVGTVNDSIQTTLLTINSSGVNDIIELGNNTFGSSLTSVDVIYQNMGKDNIRVNAAGGNVVITDVVTIDGDLSISANQVSQVGNGSINSGSLTLDAVTLAGVSTIDRLNTNVADLRVANHTGQIYINNQGSLRLSEISSIAGSLTDISASDINSAMSTVLTSAGVLNLTATNDITLLGANQITGVLGLNGNNVTVVNDTTTLAASTVQGNLTISSTFDISSVDMIDVRNGLSTLTTQSGGIFLDNVNNDFGTVNFTTGSGVGGGFISDVMIADANDIYVTNSVTGASAVGASLVSIRTNTGNITVGDISATAINLNAGGAIIDGASRGQTSELSAFSVSLVAQNGIGDGSFQIFPFSGDVVISGNAINTTTSALSAINSDGSVGVVNINNTGNVSIRDLRNSGDIMLTNSGDIVFEISNAAMGGTQGAIDANFGGTIGDLPTAGSIAIKGNNAGTTAITTLGMGNLEADITGRNLVVANVSTFGVQPTNPIRLRIYNQLALFTSEPPFIFFVGDRPLLPTIFNVLPVEFTGFAILSGQQLIDLETLGEVDPAIFTEVRNYNHDDIAILMPVDQRFTVEEDEDKVHSELETETKTDGANNTPTL